MRTRRSPPRIVTFEIDLAHPQLHDVGLDADGWRVIARRAGVPIGSGLVTGVRPPPPANLPDVVQLRSSDPPLPPPVGEPVAITIAVCTRARSELLARCLASVRLAIETAGQEVVADMLVIDNGSPGDDTRDAALAAGSRCVHEPVAGLDVARNRAVSECTGEVLAFVDDDVVVDRTWLRTLARTFRMDPSIDVVTGGVLAYRLDTAAQLDFERSGGFMVGWHPIRYARGTHDDLPFRTGVGAGCNMAFRTRTLDRIGLFDEALDTGRPMPGGGDLDMLIRSMMAGVVHYEPSALVFHDHRQTWDQLRYQYYTWGKAWAATLAKWYRRESRYRRLIRHVAWRTLRGYGRDFLLGPRRSHRYRRAHCVLLGVGFLAGCAGSYERSQRRMSRRRREAGP